MYLKTTHTYIILCNHANTKLMHTLVQTLQEKYNISWAKNGCNGIKMDA